MVRPEHVVLCETGTPGALAAVVENRAYFGAHTRLRLRCGPHEITASGDAPIGATVGVKIAHQDLHLLPA
jgi:hypothetical protein